MIPIYSATIEDFMLIPAVRMTRKGKFVNKYAKRYIENKTQLAWLFRNEARPKEPLTRECILSASITLNHRRVCDVGNLIKSIEDALQQAGIVENDRFIVGYNGVRLYRGSINRVAVKLYPITIEEA